MAVIVETRRLTLRTWESKDASDAFAIWGDSEVMRHVDFPFADLDSASRALERAAEAQERDGVSLWAIVEKASRQIIGACGFHLVADGPELELAYHLKPSHWGRGFATEAALACVDYAIQTLGATRIIAGVRVGNTASRKVLEKLGFHFERLDGGGDTAEEWLSVPVGQRPERSRAAPEATDL